MGRPRAPARLFRRPLPRVPGAGPGRSGHRRAPRPTCPRTGQLCAIHGFKTSRTPSGVQSPTSPFLKAPMQHLPPRQPPGVWGAPSVCGPARSPPAPPIGGSMQHPLVALACSRSGFSRYKGSETWPTLAPGGEHCPAPAAPAPHLGLRSCSHTCSDTPAAAPPGLTQKGPAPQSPV